MSLRSFRSIIVSLLILGLWLPGAPGLAEAPADADDELTAALGRMARIRACTSPSFSSDGKRLAFVSDMTGVPQVWVMDAEGGWPRLVTDLDDQVGGVSWSPGADVLTFSMAPGGGLNSQVYLVHPDGSGLRRITDGGNTSNSVGGWSHDGKKLTLSSNRENPQAFRAYVYDLETGTTSPMAQDVGAFYEFASDLSRDGQRAILWRTAKRGDNDLVLVEGEQELVLTPHEPPGDFSGGRFSPDGDSVYMSSNKDRDRTAFARVRLRRDEDGTTAAGPIEVLAARDDAELQGFELDDAGTVAVLHWNVAGRSELELYDLVHDMRRPGPQLEPDTVSSLTFSPDGRRLAFVGSGSVHPRNLWTWSLARSSGQADGRQFSRALQPPRQVTYAPHPGVDLAAFVQPELVRFPAHDGLELTGWLYRPPGVEEPAPYVLSFHGGPEGQERPWFRADYQALLSRGIGVLAPNVRGSSGFGKRFEHLDDGALRMESLNDIESTVRFLVDAGIGDPARLGIMGGSYGGYMTMVGLTWYPHLFAAGVNQYGIFNFLTFFEHTEPYIAAVSVTEYGDPATEEQMLRDLSPIFKLDRLEDPTLVLHGANDTNVPVVEAEQVVELLAERGVPVELVLFPDEGHGFRKTANRIRATVEMVRWFERYL